VIMPGLIARYTGEHTDIFRGNLHRYYDSSLTSQHIVAKEKE